MPDDHIEKARNLEAAQGHDDPTIAAFLDFLARDVATHPERLTTVSVEYVDRLRALVVGVEVDLDARLDDEVTI